MIIDDSLIARSAMSRLISADEDMEVVAKAGSAEIGLVLLAHQAVDVLLLDLEMPGMGGLEALPRILSDHPATQILVVSSLTPAGADHSIRALAMGAADTMPKPRSGEFDNGYRDELLSKIRILGLSPAEPVASTPAVVEERSRKISWHAPEVIAIGASTGGIHAIGQLLSNLPRSVSQPILVTQHLPPSFVASFVRQLGAMSPRKASIAEDGAKLHDGHIFVASGVGHMIVAGERDGAYLSSVTGAMPSGCTPSVDPLFESLADCFGDRAMGIILSGMGRDGVAGAARLASAGGTIMVQDQASSAVWGMPRAIAEAGLAQAILPPDRLAARIAKLCAVPA